MIANPETATFDGRAESRGASPSNLADAFHFFVRRASPRILIAATAIAAVARITLGSWSVADVVPVVVLIAVWPVQEWLIHVYVLHFKPIQVGSHTIDFPVPRKHRQHHRDPNNLEILFIPEHSFFYTLPVTVLVWVAVTPTLNLALTGLTVHFLFALNYEWVHFLVHTRVVPKSNFYRKLWKSHRLHHFKNEHYWMGVSRLGADRLFRTNPNADSVATSRTCRDLLGIAATGR